MHHPTTRKLPHRDHGVFFSLVACSTRSEDVDLYICEHSGQSLVSVGTVCFQDSMNTAFSKCFVYDASPPSNRAMFRETAQCFTNATSSKTPSPVAVRTATSDFPLVTFPSLMRTERVRARASTDGAFRFPTGVYSTAPSVQNRLYMHAFAPSARNCL